VKWNADFVEALACHTFPCNFPELEVLCRDLSLSVPAEGDVFGIEQLPNTVRAQVIEARTTLTEDLSRERLHDVLTRHRGNVRRVAQELGVQRGQLYRVLARFGLNPDLFRGLVSPIDVGAGEAAGDERRTLT
jgi:transcriptional regulator of acetoin/glycerol metabolism